MNTTYRIIVQKGDSKEEFKREISRDYMFDDSDHMTMNWDDIIVDMIETLNDGKLVF